MGFFFVFLKHQDNFHVIYTPFHPTFFIVKLGFTGVHINFLNFALKYRLWVLIRTASLRRF